MFGRAEAVSVFPGRLDFQQLCGREASVLGGVKTQSGSKERCSELKAPAVAEPEPDP